MSQDIRSSQQPKALWACTRSERISHWAQGEISLQCTKVCEHAPLASIHQSPDGGLQPGYKLSWPWQQASNQENAGAIGLANAKHGQQWWHKQQHPEAWERRCHCQSWKGTAQGPKSSTMAEQDRTQKLHQLQMQHHRRQVINNYDKTSLSSSSSLIQQLVTGW